MRIGCAVVCALILVVISREQASAQAKKVVEFLLAAIGVTLLVYSLVHAVVGPGAFLTWENAESFLVVPAMTVVFVPFFWGVMHASRWEQVRLRRRFQAHQSET